MSLIENLRPWQYTVSGGLTFRGYYTEPTGKPVLHFIHGNGFCGLVYEQLLARLQDQVDLFISDAQGHGDSDAGDSFHGWNKNIHYFSEVWMHFSNLWKDVPKIAGGHSFGAIATTVLLGQRRNLFDAALLLDPTYATRHMDRLIRILHPTGVLKHSPLAKQALIRGSEWESLDHAWEYFYKRGVFEEWHDECLNSYITHALNHHEDGSLSLKCPAHIEASIFASYTNKLWPSIKNIDCPVHVLYGDSTFPFVGKSLAIARKSNKNFNILEVPGGHCFMQEHPEETGDIVSKKFIELLG